MAKLHQIRQRLILLGSMPVYEYQCQKCERRFSRFFWRVSDAEATRCRCGSSHLEQLISRVSMPRSEESRLDSMADPSKWGDFDENDPKSMARMMKKMGSEMGEELGPEFNEVVDRLASGEDPEALEASLGSGEAGDTDNLF